MSEILVNTIKKADGTGSITVPANTGTLVDTSGATFTGAVTGTNLTLSGGVYLGGTGAANYLDDYEEGTFTPTFTPGSGSYGSYTASGFYRKVGNIVYVALAFNITNGGTASGGCSVSGLPFTHGIGSRFPIMFRENGAVGYTGQLVINASDTTGFLQKYDGNNINHGSAYQYLIAGVYAT